MKQSAAPTTTETSLLKKVDRPDVLALVPEKESIHFLNQYYPLDKPFNAFLKRSFDMVCSLLLILVFFGWLFPLIALLIKLDSKGPVFFRQKRNKKNGKLFTCIKFRTMVVNENADLLPAVVNDKRITRFGRFLREHHLDELPQLFNVLRGDMSMIGPRPHMLSDNEKYAELLHYYHYRHKVKPGITGLAQVSGHVGVVVSVDHMKERVKQDIQYIHHWSPALDAKILYRTIFRMIGSK